MATRILHAGLHKTGSTYLQRKIFPNLINTIYIHQIRFGTGPFLPTENTSPVLFSSEAACGIPCPFTSDFTPDRLLTNVRLLCIDKVIIVERDFHEWILSLWYQTLNEGHSWSLKKFININLSSLKTWQNAVEVSKKALEAEGVECLVLDHKHLKIAHDDTIRTLCDFMGVELNSRINPSLSNASRLGKGTVAAYQILNMAHRNIFCRAIFRALALTPRKMIQRGRTGAFIERASRYRYVADDVRKVISVLSEC